MSEPIDEKKPQPGSADAEQSSSSSAPTSGSASGASPTQRTARDRLPGEQAGRGQGASGPDAGKTEMISRDAMRDADKTERIPRNAVADALNDARGATGEKDSEAADRTVRQPAPAPKTMPSSPAPPRIVPGSGAASTPPRPGVAPSPEPPRPAAPADKTAFIPKSAAPPAGEETVAIPKVSDSSSAETTALPIQRPADQPTEKIRFGDKSDTDRIVPPAGARPPIGTPPITPRPVSGPKNPVPQGSSGPMQNAPTGDTSAPQPPAPPRPAGGFPIGGDVPMGGAPSPADTQPTVAEHSDARTSIATPQRIPGATPPTAATDAAPNRLGKRVLLIAGAAVVALVVVIAVIVALVGHSRNTSPQAKVSAAITAYTNALATGNLPDLQAATCGAQHSFYQSIAPDQYASVHKLAVDQRKIPKVDAVDSVQITGDKAVAQASVYTDADPTRTANTFDLQQNAGGWKVCDSPTAGR
ncbi:Rv0361 family membrane protein [Nocardia alni]|uniref:Rv0361 family membrane protein n=1 Tax=Nocardia alni TaxID=2815723 RepID=UPI0020B1FAE2|nr:hypothetical protein [Nocardia alni]